MVRPLLRNFTVLGSLLVCTLLAVAQQPGKLNVISTPEIENMRMSMRLPKDTLVEGYRLQLVSSENLGEVRRSNEKFKLLCPEHQAYLKYEPPNLKLRVGNFRYPMEAQNLYFKLREEFPYLFLVPDRVEARFLN